MKVKQSNLITFLPEPGDVPASQECESVLELALGRGIQINHTCGGYGTCGTCRVFIVEGLELLPPRNEIEQEIATDRKFQDNERLACQTPPVNGLKVEIPDSAKEQQKRD
jgi:2Fe-2S ferredoxin